MSGAPDARLFAAVELPAELSGELAEWAREAARGLGPQRGAPGLRVLEPVSLHLTLSFLGNRPASEIGRLLEALEGACEAAPELELSLGAPLWLPPRRPRALAVAIHDATGALEPLQAAVERALSGGQEGRRFRPHVTVGRARPGFARPAGIQLEATPQASFTARRVALVRSWLTPEGARYEPQGHAALGSPQGPGHSSGEGFAAA